MKSILKYKGMKKNCSTAGDLEALRDKMRALNQGKEISFTFKLNGELRQGMGYKIKPYAEKLVEDICK